MVYETSIPVNKEIRNKIRELRDNGDYNGYEDVLNDLIQLKEGYIKNYHTIKRPKVALEIHSISFDENGSGHRYDTREIYFNDLKESTVGTVFSPTKPESDYYSIETAEILYKNNDFVALGIREITESDHHEKFYTLLGVELF